MISRRALLITGGASILVLGGAYAGLSAMSHITPAQEPWKQASQGFGDVRLNAAAYAILAPNPHNMQPWQIRLDGEDSLSLFCDLDRRLPATDPPDRQITIGLGAFLELLRQAAAEQGYHADITPFPDGEPGERLDDRAIAHVRFEQDATLERDPLFSLILHRRTARLTFDPARPVPDETLARIKAATSATLAPVGSGAESDPETVARLKDISRRAWEIELRKPETCHESALLTRIGGRQINAHPDGIFLKGPMMEGLHMAGILTQEKMDEVGSIAWNATKDFYDGLIDSAPTFAQITSGNSRTQQLASGQAWVRMQLAAAQEGVGFQPLSQALEEYEEMAGPFAEIHALLGIAAPDRLQGLFRLGYAAEEAPSPRWPLESRLLT